MSPAPRPDVSIVTTGHDVADARLHRQVAAFSRAGLAVEVHGLGSAADGPAGASVRTASRKGMVVRLVRSLTWPWQARGRVLLLLDPDTVPSALLASKVRRRRLVSDVHEDYVRLLADRSWLPRRAAPAARAVTGALIGLAGRADLTVVADDHVPPDAARTRHRLVVRNLPDLGLLPAAGAGSAGDAALRALYIGDLRRSRGGREVVEAIAAAPSWQLDLVGPAPASEAAWLERRLAEPDVAGRVRWHGRQPPARAWELARGAHLGLALLERTPAFEEAMPTKVYEYLACGLAVLSTPLPRVAALLDETRAGWVVDGAEQAGTLLCTLAEDRATLGERLDAASAWSAANAGRGSDYDVLAERAAALA